MQSVRHLQNRLCCASFVLSFGAGTQGGGLGQGVARVRQSVSSADARVDNPLTPTSSHPFSLSISLPALLSSALFRPLPPDVSATNTSLTRTKATQQLPRARGTPPPCLDVRCACPDLVSLFRFYVFSVWFNSLLGRRRSVLEIDVHDEDSLGHGSRGNMRAKVVHADQGDGFCPAGARKASTASVPLWKNSIQHAFRDPMSSPGYPRPIGTWIPTKCIACEDVHGAINFSTRINLALSA
eukprot:958212-Rhodomonas_salina.1